MKILSDEDLINMKKDCRILIGFTFSGFNMSKGPYDLWPRQDAEYDVFVETIERLINELNVGVVLISHTNGFKTDGLFELIPGRDFYILNQLYHILVERNNIDLAKLKLIKKPYLPAETKALVGSFDAFVSGRAHGVVAALSQNVPCVALDYVNGPSSHKIRGFVDIYDMGDYVVQPTSSDNVFELIKKCLNNSNAIQQCLKIKNKDIVEKIKNDFNMIKSMVSIK